MTEKKATDYTNSAENLCNPEEVKALLDKLHSFEAGKESFENRLREKCSELVENIAYAGLSIAETQKQIKEAIEAHGSYQDLKTGEYAVKYRRISKTYDAEKFAEFFPKYAPAVIIQVVSEPVLEGLIKGGNIKEEELKNCEVIQEDIKFAFVIR